VLANQKGAQSSYAAGQTYDGAAAGGSNIGANGTPIGGPGAASGTGSAQPKSLAGPNDSNTSQNIPTPPGEPMAPWQSQIQKAQMLIGLSVGLLLVAKMLAKTQYGKIITQVIAAVVAAIGLLVIAIGAAIAHGKYGQTLQGGMLAAAGTGLIIAAAAAAFGGDSKGDAKTTTGLNTNAPPTAGAAPDTGMMAGIDPFVLVGGGLALVGLAGTMMMKPNKYPASSANDPNWPKGGLMGYQYENGQTPSEAALKKLIA
jgi:hypothetical protein